MKNAFWLLLIFFSFSACKSEYERIRTSGDTNLILKKAYEYYDKSDYQRAQGLFDLVLNSLRGGKDAEKAYFYHAYTYYHLKQYTLAAYYFKNFTNTFTTSSYREEAAFMSAYSNYLLSPSFRLDQSSTRQAIEDFQLFANLFPNSKRVADCNKYIDILRRKLEQKAFAEGELYFNLRQYRSSVISFENLLRDYPESPDVERVRYLIAKASLLLSQNSILEKKPERYQETINRCNDFIEKHPSGKYTKEVRQMRQTAEREMRAARKQLGLS
ncbi:MAG: outer membrane protein assembly factor BamD [Saprospiraceae bacterium]|nr:outer membrane protein assembly factor BamD [Saprospiraceae bacterium]MDW8484979.1 outer membrane protein assembly factor BamD [Saprospiraceae bacterium]